MPSTFIEPLDFKTIFVNYFLGSQKLFIFALIMLISFASASFNMSSKVFMIILALGSIMFGAYLGQSIYVFVLFLVGFFTYKAFTRLLQ